ncbi:MAG: RdgB/HAM1 family non-canonical purine NTP pyrophosphatase [Betaproteobacteria bacterium]|nr:MAG: RdgB/HAM1 family non-canonical purine NTP pyrophosphatase [Betaproteobacteria bacterium]
MIELPASGKLVIASGNPGKLSEIGRLLMPFGLEIVAQSELGVSPAEEPHPTFVENALAKARHVSAATGLPALADDSGICVPALGGEPGVHSARYAGTAATDELNNVRLLQAMSSVTDRRAHYYCVIVLLRQHNDPQPIIAEGKWHGDILRAPRGAGGFGYDPVFLDPGSGLTGAELAPSRKNRVSHRGKAMRKLLRAIKSS